MRILTLLFLLFSFHLGAQDVIVYGTIRNAGGIPIEQVLIVSGTKSTYSNEIGEYRITVKSPATLIFARMGFKNDTITFSTSSPEYELNRTLISDGTVLNEVQVEDRRKTDESVISLDPKSMERLAGPQQGVEALIKTLPGVVSNNEFSSQYNVRGGNFDENLVYINGIEVYRPFLVRSGQQEGLSIINPDLVGNLNFSAGGFRAIYGDKMSSVLDIQYRKPDSFAAKFQASMLGGSVSVEGSSGRWSTIGGLRYRTNSLLIGSLDTKADFRSQFTDAQVFTTYRLTDDWDLSFLGTLAQNDYRIVPTSRTTEFGTISEVLQLNVFLEGQEHYQYKTGFGALSAENRPNEHLKLNYYVSGYQTVEQEDVDVLGAYRLGELNNNLGSDDFGEIAYIRGTGGFQNYARNKLDAIIGTVGHRGTYTTDKGNWYWGLSANYEDIIDRYKEWENVDSAGYTVPHRPTEITIDPVTGDTIYLPKSDLDVFESFDTRAHVISTRIQGYVEYVRQWEADSSKYKFTIGGRSQHWSYNGQTTFSPRASFTMAPKWHPNMIYRASFGYYHQMPFYREMRNLQGSVNSNIQAQLAVHYVLGMDYKFKWRNRSFLFVAEAYYKDLQNLIAYEIDNVRIRYSAENNSRGFSTGIDMRLNGEFIKGIDSWASLSLFTVQEDIDGDNSGYIPRPTDQRYSFAVTFQDYWPTDPTFRVSLNLMVTGGFPFGPPQTPREDDIYRSSPYRRIDLGFIKVLRQPDKEYSSFFMRNIKEMWIGLEVFNIVEIRNTVSYLWIRDASTANQYAVPNYLTNRLINLKFFVKI